MLRWIVGLYRSADGVWSTVMLTYALLGYTAAAVGTVATVGIVIWLILAGFLT